MDLSNVVFIENKKRGKQKKKGKGKEKENQKQGNQNGEKPWNLVPPKANEPWTKRRKGKTYYYCRYCKYWALHQPGKGKSCAQAEPLADLVKAFGDQRSFQSSTWFDKKVTSGGAPSNGSIFASPTVGTATGDVTGRVPYNQPFGSPLPEKKSMFSVVGNSFAGANTGGNGIFGGGPSSLGKPVNPSPFGVVSLATTTAGEHHNSPFGTLSGVSNGSANNPGGQSPFRAPLTIRAEGRGSSFGKSFSFPESDPSPSQSIFGAPAKAQNHTAFGLFGSPSASKVLQPASQPFGSQYTNSFRSSIQPRENSRVDNHNSSSIFGSSLEASRSDQVSFQNSSSIFGWSLEASRSDQVSFCFGNTCGTAPLGSANPQPSPVQEQSPTAFTFAPQPEKGNSFNFSGTIPSSSSSFSWSQPSKPEVVAPTAVFPPIPSPTPQGSPPIPAERAPESPQSAPPSFLYDHYPSQIVTPPPYGRNEMAIPIEVEVVPSSSYSSNMYSLRLNALEAKRREVAQYLVH